MPGLRGSVEGVSVEFYPDKAEPWFATFAGGVSPNAANFSGSHPNKTHAVVVSKGEGYVVNVSNPNDWEELSIRPIMGVAVKIGVRLKSQTIVLTPNFLMNDKALRNVVESMGGAVR